MASQCKKTEGRKMTLYQCPMFRSLRCMWLIHELGAIDDFQFVKLDSINKKDSDEYREYVRSVHPHGTIPALVIKGGEVILESAAICLYLADLYGRLAPPATERKDYYDWSVYAVATMDEVTEFLYWKWVVPKGDSDPEGIKKMEAKYDICMKRLTETLKGRTYICGDSFTAADCILGYSVWAAAHDLYNKGSLVNNYPEVKAYVQRLKDRPAFKAAMEAQMKVGEDNVSPN